MSLEKKGSMPVTVYVTREPDRSGNYVCNGTADNVDINLAIVEATRRGGGVVFLGEGNYDVAATVNMLSNVILRGSGFGTVLTLANGVDDHVITALGNGGHLVNIGVEYIRIHGNKANQGAGQHNGVDFYWVDHSWVKNFYIEYCHGNSVDIADGHDLVVDKGFSSNNAWNGPSFGTNVTEGRITNQFVEHSSDAGVADNGTGTLFSNITIRDMDGLDGSSSSQYGAELTGNDAQFMGFIIDNVAAGIVIRGAFVRVDDGMISQWDRNDEYGSAIATNDLNTVISDVTIEDCGSIHGRGAFFETGADNGIVQGCDIIAGTASYGVVVDAPDGVTIRNNNLAGAYGIRLYAGSVGTIVEKNNITATTRAMWDQGTGTILLALSGDFSKFGGGSSGQRDPVINAAPGGIDIDANDEFVFALIPLPDEFQEAVRIKIWAYSRVDEADRMRLRIVAHGATDNEAWSGNAIDVPDHPSETVNFANNDVVHWEIDDGDDAQLLTLAAGDLVELLAVGEVAGGADAATDVSMGGWVIYHV